MIIEIIISSFSRYILRVLMFVIFWFCQYLLLDIIIKNYREKKRKKEDVVRMSDVFRIMEEVSQQMLDEEEVNNDNK